MGNRRWSWDTETSEWGAELDEAAGLVRWSGWDKERPGVPYYALAGGARDQTIDDLLATGRPGYDCPAPILAEILDAARATRSAR